MNTWAIVLIYLFGSKHTYFDAKGAVSLTPGTSTCHCIIDHSSKDSFLCLHTRIQAALSRMDIGSAATTCIKATTVSAAAQ